MKKIAVLIGCLIVSILLVIVEPMLFHMPSQTVDAAQTIQASILEQKVVGVLNQSHPIHKIYQNGNLLGILTDQSKLNSHLSDVYREKYKVDFPNSEVSLSEDIYIVDEESFNQFEDIDSKILSYLDEHEMYALKVTAVEFSNEQGKYAEIYVKNSKLYESAMQSFLSLFVSPSELEQLNFNGTTAPLKTFGSRALSVTIRQTITLKDAYASPSKILKTEGEVLEYLEYGDNKEREYYTVQKYDTVGGVGARTNGLSAEQIMNINRDKISSIDQVLSEGEQLCITYFTSPIDVVVKKERLQKEPIFFKIVYSLDNTIRVGQYLKKQQGVDGSKNVMYEEQWINGVLVEGKEISSIDTLQPIDEVMLVGSMQVPGVGTGTFRFPVENAIISNGWLGYPGHQGLDFQNRYNRWDKVYASDRGVVVENSYHPISGYYLVIDHNNGWRTYYGHMRVPSPIPVGTAVDKGDVIGDIGQTGKAYGPHVHFYIEDYQGNKYDGCNGFFDCTGIITGNHTPGRSRAEANLTSGANQ